MLNLINKIKINTKNQLLSFIHLLCITFFFICITTLIVDLFRIIFVNSFSEEVVEINEYISLFVRALSIDLHSGVEYALPIIILGGILIIFNKNKELNSLIPYLISIITLYCAFACIANFYFFKTFNNIIDTFFFNFFTEDKIALIKTIYYDYPLIQFSLVLLVLSFISLIFYKFIYKFIINYIRFSSYKSIISILAILLLCLEFSYNGGISFHKLTSARPRSVSFSNISNNRIINASLSNPMTLISWRFNEYMTAKRMKITPVNDEELMSILNDFKIKYNIENPLSSLIKTTSYNEYLDNNKPNIVIVYEESFSEHLSKLSDLKNNFDTLGSLNEFKENNYYFNNLISEENSTLYSLLRFSFHFTHHDVSSSAFALKGKYDTFFLKPYKDKGYKLVFITASDCGWGNVDKFFKANGVDEFICASDILQTNKNAKIYTWGVQDQYLFDSAINILDEAVATSQPVAIFILTTLNHPPYDLTKDLTNDLNDNINYSKKYDKNLFSNYDLETFIKQIKTFKYAADSLGDFINYVKSSKKLKDSTVIAFTGDHNARISYNKNSDALLSKSVATGIYIPEVIIDHGKQITYDANRISSNKDILPTLYENTISQGQYIKLGCNILSSESSCPFDFAYNVKLTVDNKGNSSLESTDDNRAKFYYKRYSDLLQWLFNKQMNEAFHNNQ
jgi:phosphoglycerol transferase MdoB-like AlkP superfamily enzyme